MSVRDNFTLDNAKEIIEYALEQLYKNDSALVQYPSIKEAVSENCLLFRIGLYMHDFIRQNSLFSNISVDCQYNRNFQHPKSMFKPTLEGIEKAVKNPIPDLLLHQRGSNENNLFLIELKKGEPLQKEIENDAEKLCYFTNETHEYKYAYGFSIWLYKRSWARIKVYQNGKERSHLDYVWRCTRRK